MKRKFLYDIVWLMICMIYSGLLGRRLGGCREILISKAISSMRLLEILFGALTRACFPASMMSVDTFLAQAPFLMQRNFLRKLFSFELGFDCSLYNTVTVQMFSCVFRCTQCFFDLHNISKLLWHFHTTKWICKWINTSLACCNITHRRLETNGFKRQA